MQAMKSLSLSMKYLTVFLLSITSVLNTRYIWTRLSTITQEHQKEFSYKGHDHPHWMPTPFSKFPEALMVVEESVHYPVLGPASDKEWFSVTSSSYGYIRLGPEHRLFHAAMAHELHCLRMLNLAFGNTSFPDTGHIQHCLNRIRQSILCDSDLTLEPGNFEERDFTLERVGATHVCQDWAVLYDIMDENTISWLNATQPSVSS